jgi:hypothetical protein
VPPNSQLPCHLTESSSPHFHEQCGCPKSADNSDAGEYEFYCELPAGCHHQDQKSADLARKCVSDYFGRNKKCTEMIPNQIIWCRAHYQAAQYQQDVWKFQKIGLIDEQFLRNEKAVPGLQYTVTLKVSEATRLDKYLASIRSTKKPEQKSKRGQNYEAHPEILRYIENRWVGEHKSMKHCQSLLIWAYSFIKRDLLTQMPMVVFLPEFDTLGRHKLQKNQANGLTRAEKIVDPRGYEPSAMQFDASLLDIDLSATQPLLDANRDLMEIDGVEKASEADENDTELDENDADSSSASTISFKSPPPAKRRRTDTTSPQRVLRFNRSLNSDRPQITTTAQMLTPAVVESSHATVHHIDVSAMHSLLNGILHRAATNDGEATGLLLEIDRILAKK